MSYKRLVPMLSEAAISMVRKCQVDMTRALQCATGVDFLWRVVLDMPSKEGQSVTSSHAVVRASQELLIRLYQRQDSDSHSPVPCSLCEHFVG